MAAEGSAARKADTAPAPDDPRKPDSPDDLHKPSWKFTFKKAWMEFGKDQCTDLAAALTYYSIMAIFPALIALVSLLGVFGQGQSTTDAMLQMLRDMGQSSAADTLKGPISSMVSSNKAGIGLIVGILGALWSASGYVGAFGRTMNRIYEVDEGRPIWKLRPLQLVITLALVIMAALILLGMVLSGSLVQTVGSTIGLSDASVLVWNIVKWPVMLLLVMLMIALLYYSTPNVKQPKFKWVSVGAAIAIVTAILGSLAFGFYVANFGSYNKTYGALAGVIVSLLWIWLMNLALLFGAEVDAEMERARQLQAGIAAEEHLQLPPRDTTGSEKNLEKREKVIAEGREIREAAIAGGATGEDPSGLAKDGTFDGHSTSPAARQRAERDSVERGRDLPRGREGATSDRGEKRGFFGRRKD